MTVAELLEDLRAEQQTLDDIVAPLHRDQWRLPTPSPRWTIAHQIAHLTYFDRSAALAIEDPVAFADEVNELVAAGMAGDEQLDERTIGDLVRLDPSELIDSWRRGRVELAGAAAGLGDGDRVEWYGPSMGARSFLSARLMECWAHGQDIVDALAVAQVESTGRPQSDRLRHIAHLGVVTRGWSYAVRGEEAPDTGARVELTAPSGGIWTWGDAGSENRISGPAEDFCLVVTQRRHVDDTDLAVTGESARSWMHRAQAFAGGATQGPAAGSFN